MKLFNAQFRIQREACEAAGRHIPMVVENVKGAQKWVGESRWNFGSYHLWGDVPALMPIAVAAAKAPGQNWNRYAQTGEVSPHWRLSGRKNTGGSWFGVAHNTTSGVGRNQDGRAGHAHCAMRNDPRAGIKHRAAGAEWFDTGAAAVGGSKRKFASALIAKIPFDLAQHIARVYYPARLAA